jgi:hypothetical protein
MRISFQCFHGAIVARLSIPNIARIAGSTIIRRLQAVRSSLVATKWGLTKPAMCKIRLMGLARAKSCDLVPEATTLACGKGKTHPVGTYSKIEDGTDVFGLRRENTAAPNVDRNPTLGSSIGACSQAERISANITMLARRLREAEYEALWSIPSNPRGLKQFKPTQKI